MKIFDWIMNVIESSIYNRYVKCTFIQMTSEMYSDIKKKNHIIELFCD